MAEIVTSVRRIGLVVAGVGSILLGLLVAWTFVRPGVIGGVGTGALAAIFGLLSLPGVVYWFWTLDRRAAVRQAARRRTLAAASDADGADVPRRVLVGVAGARCIGREAGAAQVVQHDGARGDERRERPHRAAPRTVHVG
ncbi:MAG: hypothetical protein KF912_03690 [Phycisphaeraceae bacterium]|nr:hypothetical protein [Phycisphaeraceae bacterium]MBX3366399.1 hypothetical protein [Phycisphaeraceae bacterium]QYK47720.1 MAG: hypothetical protein KF838_13120 [Phycisphaeraceae bacterium]